MAKLTALREVRYAGATRRPGEEFEATDKDARILKGLRKAQDAPERKKYQRRAMESAPTPPVAPVKAAVQAAQETQSQRRFYNRRDMQAED